MHPLFKREWSILFHMLTDLQQTHGIRSTFREQYFATAVDLHL
jgi:hypothetical protein